jgi:hypothetical protein
MHYLINFHVLIIILLISLFFFLFDRNWDLYLLFHNYLQNRISVLIIHINCDTCICTHYVRIFILFILFWLNLF